MLDARFKSKLQQLRALFTDGDESVHHQISQWEADIARLSSISDFVELPTVKHIVMVLKDRLKTIILEKVKTGTTPILDAREKELRYCLGLFMPKYESELESLEAIIDNELIS